MNIYDELDYKVALRKALDDRKKCLGQRFTYERVAERVGLQKTYLSRMLRSDGPHLNVDQLFKLAEVLELERDERDYLHLLLEHERSQVEGRKQELQQAINAIRQRQQRSEAHIKMAGELNTNERAEYFLKPDLQLVHMFLCIERFRCDTAKVAGKLGLSLEELRTHLITLERLNLIELDGDKVMVCREQAHLPVESPLCAGSRVLMRLKAMQRYERLSAERSYNFGVVFTATESERLWLREEFLKILSQLKDRCDAAPAEEVYQMSFDLFDWSR